MMSTAKEIKSRFARNFMNGVLAVFGHTPPHRFSRRDLGSIEKDLLMVTRGDFENAYRKTTREEAQKIEKKER